MEVVSDLGHGSGWAAAGIALAALGGSRGRRTGLASNAASLTATFIAQDLLKPIFRRRRPWFTREAALVVGRRTPDHAFPSGHAAASFAAATVIAVAYPWARPPALASAAAVALSRVYLGHHFVSDVVAGALTGTAIGLLAAKLARLSG